MNETAGGIQALVDQPQENQKNSFWRKLGGGSLTISIIVHAILLLVAAFLIIWTIPADPDPKKVDFMPSGGGGGNPASSQRSQKQTASMMKPNMARISVAGAASSITLPEMDASSQMSSLGSISSGAMSGGLGGAGSGGGRGDGFGKGFGSGTGPGAGIGAGTVNPFGLTDSNASALEGSLYDLKQNRSKKPTGVGPAQALEFYTKFTTGGMRETVVNEYFRAPKKLYQTKIYMPEMNASEAPAAFQVQNEVEPRCWLVIYRGSVIAPKTGKFRLVGRGDDVMVVRFNGRLVLDHGYNSATLGDVIGGLLPVLTGKVENNELERRISRSFPMKIPVTYYEYPAVPPVAAGVEFDVVAGRAYPIEIMVSEVHGGYFSAVLLVEEVGATYNKASTGSPILPLFRTDFTNPKVSTAAVPSFDPNGPVWRVKKGGSIGF
ncbi:MAG: hypothetical protein V4733_04710 [Verrucomicrobiota bacterium]